MADYHVSYAKTLEFLGHCGMNWEVEGDYFVIEMYEVPSALTKVGMDNPNGSWSIFRINEAGITLYYAHFSPDPDGGIQGDAGDAHVFIPMTNIIAFHTITPKFAEQFCAR